MTKNSVYSRFSKISHGTNTDASDEYYTLYHSFVALFIELLCRYNSGIKYKVIICPCDSETSIFRQLEFYKGLIGSPKIIYSFYPEKMWEDYFDMDYEKEYGCKAEEVCIFTNPPFKNLSKNIRNIKCDYLVFGSNAVSIRKGIYCKIAKVSLYIKNNNNYTGNADEFQDTYGTVSTCFYSNKRFLSEGLQYTNDTDVGASILFGKDKLTEIKDGENEN